MGTGVVVCLDVAEELVVGAVVVEVVNNAVVSTNTKVVALKVVALLALLDRIVLLVVTGVVQNGVVVVIDGFELGVGVVAGTDRGVEDVGFEVLRGVVAGGVCCDISR